MTGASAAPPPVGSDWKRLHPLSPVVRFGRIAVGLIVIAIPALESGGGHRPAGDNPLFGSLAVWAVLVAASLVAGFVSWLVTRWRIGAADLQIETGLIRRQSIRIPLARVQAVDIYAPLLGRVFGLAEVRVVSAGRGGERGRLGYLTAAEAVEARARLLALAHGLDAATPEPDAIPLLKVSNGRLLLALAMRASVAWPLLLMLAAIVTLLVSPHVGVAVLSTSFSALVTAALAAAAVVNSEFDFAISEAGDGLRLDRGLLQRRHETIPFGRIQALRVVRPLLWRPAGWLRLEVDVARQHGSRESRDDPSRLSRTLVPVGRREEVLAILARVFPEAGIEAPPEARPPRRAMLKAPFSYHFLAAWYGTRYLYARTGRVQEATVVVPLPKSQSARLSSGPVQRAMRLATVHTDTAGQRWHAEMRCRDADEANRWLWEISDRARLARRRVVRVAPPAPAGVGVPAIG